MEIKNADWEKRNLGVITTIFYAAPRDCAEDAFRCAGHCQSDYQQMIVPSGNVEVLVAAQKLGFRVVEMQVHLSVMLDELHLPRLYQRFGLYLSYSFAEGEEIHQIRNRIESGEMFLTDKIAMDPLFGAKTSGKRYALWMDDMVRDGALVIAARYKDEVIGFEVCVDMGKDAYSVQLGGVFPDISRKGLGFAPLYVSSLALKDLGAKKAFGHASSNNLPALKCSELLGYRVCQMDYVLVKHLNQDF